MFTTTLDFLDTKNNKTTRKIVFESNVTTYLSNNLAFQSDPLDFTYDFNHPKYMDHTVIKHILDFMRINHNYLIPEGY